MENPFFINYEEFPLIIHTQKWNLIKFFEVLIWARFQRIRHVFGGRIGGQEPLRSRENFQLLLFFLGFVSPPS